MTDRANRGSAKHLEGARLIAANAEKDGLTFEQIVDRVYDQVVGDVRVTLLENYEWLRDEARDPSGNGVSPSEFIWSEFIIGRVE
jgi:hypothetical protein